MKETGLMFKAPLVRAILSGQKTQTRRIFKTPNGGAWPNPNDKPGMEQILRSCPLGHPGDRIYVRETFVQGYRSDPMTGVLHQWDEDGNEVPMTTWYRATDSDIGWQDDDGWETDPPWRPSIHMPKAAARIWLEVTGVRLERLQSISRADAIAEGIEFFNNDHECGAKNYADKTGMDWTLCPADSFETLWKSTGGDWAANPWVWVINFKHIEMPKGSAA